MGLMTYRDLTPSEIEGIAHEFTSRGHEAPGIGMVVVGAFDEDGTLQGFQCIQFQLHVEPMVIYDPHVLRGLSRAMEDRVRKNFGSGTPIFAMAIGRTAEIAKTLGYSRRDEFVFEKVVI